MWNTRTPPSPTDYRYIVTGLALKMGPGDIRQPGQEAPEIFDYPRGRQLSLLSTHRIAAVPRAGAGISEATFKKAVELLSAKGLQELAAWMDIAEEDVLGAKRPQLIDVIMAMVGARPKATPSAA